MTRKTVYSMAYGGYGPAHSLILWDEAAALGPQIVIEAFYAGNDLFDSFNLVYNLGQLRALRSPDPQLQERLRQAEDSEPVARRIADLFRMDAADAAPTPMARDESLLRRILAHSRIYGLVRRAEYEIALRASPGKDARDRWERARAFATAHPAHCQIFDDGPFKTVFTSEYRLAALDLGDPRITEGLRISLAAIRRMRERAAARKIRFLVLLIPTKEHVFSRVWQKPSMSYRSLIDNEERVWKIAKEFFEQHQIEYLDSLPALREQLAAGIQPYMVSHDGHPNELGHRAIARVVATSLVR